MRQLLCSSLLASLACTPPAGGASGADSAADSGSHHAGNEDLELILDEVVWGLAWDEAGLSVSEGGGETKTVWAAKPTASPGSCLPACLPVVLDKPTDEHLFVESSQARTDY